jgi:hypothetical protein
MSATAEPYSIGILRSGATNISGDTEQAIRCKRTARDEFPSGDPQVSLFWRFPKKFPFATLTRGSTSVRTHFGAKGAYDVDAH